MQLMQPLNLNNQTDLGSTDGTTHFVPVFVAPSALPRPLVRAPLAQVRPRQKKRALSFGLKIAGAFVLLVACVLGFSQVGSTVSVYLDVEQSLNNTLVADPLEFSVAFATTSIDMGQGEQLLVPVFTPGADSEPIQYFVQAKILDGDSDFCSQLGVLTTAPFPYDGPLSQLRTSTTTDLGSWALTVYNSPQYAQTGVSCRVDMVYTGWNANAPWGAGYTDIEHVQFLFYIAATTSTPEAPIAPPVIDGAVEGTSTEATEPPPDATTTTPDVPPVVDTPPVGGGGGNVAPPADDPPANDPAPDLQPPADPPADSAPTTDTPPADPTPPPADTTPPAADTPAPDPAPTPDPVPVVDPIPPADPAPATTD